MLVRRLRRLIQSLCVLSFISVPVIGMAAEPSKPEFFRFKLGKIEIISLQDAAIEMESQLVKNGDPAVIKTIMPSGKLPASVNVFLIKSGKRTILVDAGTGEGSAGKGVLLQCLKAAGITPADIDTVVITHAHFDHTGGLVNNGKAVFPSARLIYSKKELNALYSEPAKQSVKIYKGKVEGVVPGDMITEGVKVVELYGHTPGQIGLLIEDENQKLLLFGDLLHITNLQFPHPDYSLVYDSDIKVAPQIRSKILGMAADEKMYIGGAHIKFPGIGTVVKKGDSYIFKPVK